MRLAAQFYMELSFEYVTGMLWTGLLESAFVLPPALAVRRLLIGGRR